MYVIRTFRTCSNRPCARTADFIRYNEFIRYTHVRYNEFIRYTHDRFNEFIRYTHVRYNEFRLYLDRYFFCFLS